jgi:hypothetical protein
MFLSPGGLVLLLSLADRARRYPSQGVEAIGKAFSCIGNWDERGAAQSRGRQLAP